ncbi:hypothetical protein BM1_02348 [Bipolaris maydis]|nr:hypothetical protein BM1_02348 [Bipolaris maydis]
MAPTSAADPHQLGLTGNCTQLPPPEPNPTSNSRVRNCIVQNSPFASQTVGMNTVPQENLPVLPRNVYLSRRADWLLAPIARGPRDASFPLWEGD